MFMMKIKVLILLAILLINPIFAEENDNSLEFSAMKTKYISMDLNITMPIYVSGYTENSEFTYKTAIFSNYKTQTVDIEAYYFDENNNKIFAEIINENGNRYAIFKVKPVTKTEYLFYISGSIVSENKTTLNNQDHNLNQEILEEKEYTLSSRFIQSNSLEIKTIAKYLKQSEDAIENLVNVTNWVHDYLEYDNSYIEEVIDSKTILSEKKGVCDEFAILEAAILRAQGYPVKYVVGYANTSQEWGPHAWLEVYIPNQGWIPVDPTYNEVGFVDSSHIVLEKLKDPVESKDSVTSTSNIEIAFGNKTHNFKHNETRNYQDSGYENIIKMSMIFNKDNLSSSPFNVKLNLINTTSSPVAVLVVSQISQDFNQIYPNSRKKIYYLKGFEEKNVDYFFILPSVDNSYSYSFGFSSQLNDIEDFVNIHKNKGIYQELFLANNPIIFFKDNYFYFEQDFFNYSNKDKNINFNFDYNGDKTSKQIIIQKNNTTKYTVTFPILEDANFNYLISGDYSFSGQTFFYKEHEEIISETEEELIDSNVEDVNNYEKIFNNIDKNRIEEKSKLNYVSIVFIVLFMIFIVYLFVMKSIKSNGLQ